MNKALRIIAIFQTQVPLESQYRPQQVLTHSRCVTIIIVLLKQRLLEHVPKMQTPRPWPVAQVVGTLSLY